MRNYNLKDTVFALVMLTPFLLLAQPNDCRRAIVICDDKPILFNPSFGSGNNDFQSSKNRKGCLQRGENISVWFYFELRKDMPVESGKLAFTLTDSVQIRGQDYDFAIYGPQTTCDSLGDPIRCSFAQINPNQRIIQTGLGQDASDKSEGLDGDGFLDTLRVKPGDGYFLLIDFFVGVGGSTFDSAVALSFNLTWGGPAAPYLNCIANPNCDIVKVSAGPDTTLCSGVPISLKAEATNTAGKATVQWTNSNNLTGFLDSAAAFQPMIFIPPDVSGKFSLTATVTEGNCVHSDEMELNILPAPLPKISGDTVLCGGKNATLRADPGYQQYQWSNGASGVQSIAVSETGLYSLTVTDNNGCSGSTFFLIKEIIPAPPRINGDTILCPNEQSLLSAETGFASYQWNTGSRSAAIMIQTPGIYSVTVTDSNGCIASSKAEVKGILPQQPFILGKDYFCKGGTVTLSTGQSFETYLWSDGRKESSIVINQPGSYSLTVSDIYGCVSDAEVKIIERQNPIVKLRGDSIFCSGGSTLLRGPGGFASYAWTGGGKDSFLLITTPGNYTLTVADSFGCSASAAMFVDTLAQPQIAFTGPSSFCEGSFGRISPGNFATYKWSTGEIFPDIRIDTGGIYQVTVTGFNGCTATGAFPVTVYRNPRPEIIAPKSICPKTTIEIRTQATFDQYLWNTGDTAAFVKTALAGLYQVTVTDRNGCSGSAGIQITAATTPEVKINGVNEICDGDTARLSATGDFPFYSWSNGERTPEIQTNRPGKYIVAIADSNGCTAIDSFQLKVLFNPPVWISGPTKFCSGSFTTLKVPAGYAAYAWSTGSRDSLIKVFQPGRYSVTVTTEEGCARTHEATVESDIAIRPLLEPANYSICADTFKRFEAGPGFISYTWSDGSTRPFLDISDPGNYNLTVLDSNFCISSVDFSVTRIPVIPPILLGPDSFCQGQRVSLFATGSGFTQFLWSTGDRQSMTFVSQPGTYTLQATDLNGCVSRASKSLGVKPAPEVRIVGDLDICRGESTTLAVTGKFRTFEWSTSGKDSTLTVSLPGPYGVSAIGENGCTGSDEVIVRLSRIPYPVIDGDRFFCSNDSIALEVEEGFERYSWTTGQQSNRIFVNQEGTYGVTVTDDLGCEGIAQIRVFTIPAPELRISGKTAFCPGDSVRLTAPGGFQSYQWSNGVSEDSAIWVKTPGWQRLEVTAANQCKDVDSVFTAYDQVPEPKISGRAFLCKDSVSVLSVADTFAFIRWNNGLTSSTIQVRNGGTYRVSTVNSSGCIASDSITVEEIPNPDALAGPDTFLTCSRREVVLSGSIFPTRNGPYKLFWAGPGIRSSDQHLFMPRVGIPGTYQLAVIDTLHGCSSLPSRTEIRDSAYVPLSVLKAEDSLNCFSPQIYLSAVGSATGKRLVYAWKQLSRDIIPGSDSLRLSINRPGEYAFIITDTLFGCSSTSSIRIGIDTVAPIPTIQPADTLTCARTSVTLKAGPPRPGDIRAYSWQHVAGQTPPFSSTAIDFVVNRPGQYVLKEQNLINGCVGSTTTTVFQDTLQPVAKGGPDEELDCVALEITLNGATPDSSWRYQWRDAATGFILSRKPSITLELPGVYLYEAIDPVNGCLARDTVVVTTNSQVPKTLQVSVKDETCSGRSDGRMTIVNTEGGTPPFIYRLSGNSSFSTSNHFTGLKPGAYRITLQDAKGCELNERFEILPGIAATLNLGEDMTIKLGERVQIRGLTNIPDGALARIEWQRPDTLKTINTLSLSLAPVMTTEYVATVKDTNGCSATDSLTIFVERTQRVFFPNAFSPNGDGVNDVFMAFSGPEVARIITLRLYNRWGTLMSEFSDFPPNDPAFGWTGIHRGEMQNPGVYVFYAEVEFLDGSTKTFKGDFTLMR